MRASLLASRSIIRLGRSLALRESRKAVQVSRRRGADMALHDWSDRPGWEGMHHLWITELLRWVKPRLPVGYRAYIGSAPFSPWVRPWIALT